MQWDKERKKKQMFLHGMLAHLEIPDTPEQPDVFHFRIVVVVLWAEFTRASFSLSLS